MRGGEAVASESTRPVGTRVRANEAGDENVATALLLVAAALSGGAAGILARRWRWTDPETGRACRTDRGRDAVAAVITAVLFVAVAWAFGPTLEAVAYAFLAAVGVRLSAIDLRHRLLPNRIVLPATAIALVLLAAAALGEGNGGDLVRSLLSGVALFGVYLVLALISPNGLGMGDVKLAGMVGMYLGFAGWPAVLLGTLAAFILAAVAGIAALALRRAHRRSAVPFGPFMLAGAALVLLTGSSVTGAVFPLL